MIEPGSAAFGGVIVAMLAGVGWILKRLISREGHREQASLYQNYASIAGTMKSHGLNSDDVQAIAIMIGAKKTKQKASIVSPSMVSPEADVMADVPSYWTQGAMNVRAAAAAQLANAQLASALSEYSTVLPPEEAEAFVVAQSAWEQYRSAQVNFEAQQVAGGSMEPLIRHSEEEAITLKRVAEITAMVERRKETEGL